MKHAPHSHQHHDLYRKYHDHDSEISGLLGECGMMALMMDEVGPGKITSFDLGERVYYDRTKAVGYLIDEIAPNRKSRIEINTGTTSVDVSKKFGPGSVDFCFIDASHQHPWPIIDTLCMLPFMRSGGIIVHHDLQLYRSKTNALGVGPKILFDQLAPVERITVEKFVGRKLDERLKMRTNRKNIFAFRRPDDFAKLGLRLAQGLYLPWSIDSPIPEATIKRIRGVFDAHYPASVSEALGIGAQRHASYGARRKAQA